MAVAEAKSLTVGYGDVISFEGRYVLVIDPSTDGAKRGPSLLDLQTNTVYEERSFNHLVHVVNHVKKHYSDFEVFKKNELRFAFSKTEIASESAGFGDIISFKGVDYLLVDTSINGEKTGPSLLNLDTSTIYSGRIFNHPVHIMNHVKKHYGSDYQVAKRDNVNFYALRIEM